MTTNDFCSGGDCVAVFRYDDGSATLYSTRRPHATVFIDADEWAAFLVDVKGGRYDGPPQIERRNPSMPAEQLRARVINEGAA